MKEQLKWCKQGKISRLRFKTAAVYKNAEVFYLDYNLGKNSWCT